MGASNSTKRGSNERNRRGGDTNSHSNSIPASIQQPKNTSRPLSTASTTNTNKLTRSPIGSIKEPSTTTTLKPAAVVPATPNNTPAKDYKTSPPVLLSLSATLNQSPPSDTAASHLEDSSNSLILFDSSTSTSDRKSAMNNVEANESAVRSSSDEVVTLRDINNIATTMENEEEVNNKQENNKRPVADQQANENIRPTEEANGNDTMETTMDISQPITNTTTNQQAENLNLENTVTPMTGIQMNDNTPPVNNTVPAAHSPHQHSTSVNPMTTSLPPSLPPPPPNDMIILFDLETTGLPLNSEICQISAQVLGEERVWSRYLVPTRNISPGASRVNGLRVGKDENGKRILLKDGKEVPAKSYIDGLKDFYTHLCLLSRKQKNLDPNGRLILLAHNGQRYDAPVLINALRKISVSVKKLNDIGVCFSDSLVILRSLQREGCPLLTSTEGVDGGCGVQLKYNVSLKLTSIHNHLFGKGFPAHDATEDVKAMKHVLFDPPLQLPHSIISDNTFKPEQV